MKSMFFAGILASALLFAPLVPLPLLPNSSSAFAQATPAVIQLLPAFVQAPTDKAKFRRFVMTNGMKVILVSDPKFNKSAASLVVHTGQIDDPRDTEGLAHFLEHMLFLGTEKYPDITDYGNYINANGGYNNAYTTSDHTNYQFQIRHEAFAGGLDRFAQFFIAPKFNPAFVSREVSAVNNEAMRHLQNDSRRQVGVLREMYDPSSGESKFSTGNKDTLAKADPAAVRAFYEKHYSADRMALALTGNASLDDLEKMAREHFSAVPKRNVPPLVREAKFIPIKESVRIARIEPIKEVRKLSLEFIIPATRPDFAGKPGELVTQLLTYPGEGGLATILKRDGLINSLGAYVWERADNYGSIFIEIELTPAGLEANRKVLGAVFSYIEHLRTSAFPNDFFADRARIAQLQETFSDRGEGAELATRLANQALFYPLEVAERATSAWGKPDEAAYRRLLDALRPSRMLGSLVAKGQPADRKERIYETRYSLVEEIGPAYEALAKPAKMSGFALPKTNPFMPAKSDLLTERPVALINEPTLQLHYAQDTEYLRPTTSLVMRFVPIRETATADNMALLRLMELTLADSLTPNLGDAALAGVSFSSQINTDGYRVSISGLGDSAPRFAQFFAERLRNYTVTPARFEAMKEIAIRSIKSYAQTEAFRLAGNRRDALSREFLFLPPEQLAATEKASFQQVQEFAKRYFAKGRLEVLVHGNLPAEDAVKVTREIASKVATTAAAEKDLLRRRHMTQAANEHIVDSGPIEGANSALIMDYLLSDESPATRATGLVLSNFFGQPFYAELRTKQQLGYIVGSSSTASLRQRYFTFVIQSTDYGPVQLRERAEAFIATIPSLLAGTTDAQWQSLIAGARSNLEEKPKSIEEKADTLFSLAYEFNGEWERRALAIAELNKLTKEQAIALLTRTLSGNQVQRRSILLYAQKHANDKALNPTFSDRAAWKAGREFK